MHEKMVRTNNSLNIRKLFVIVLAVYIIFAVSFYFLAGEQLHFRESRHNLAPLQAEAGTIELAKGATLDQVFECSINKLKEVSVQFGIMEHLSLNGTVTISVLLDGSDEILMSKTVDAASISELQFVSLVADKPILNSGSSFYRIHIYGDSEPGLGVSPLMSFQKNDSLQDVFYINSEPIDGTLCFSASGDDFIWTGLHYWEIVSVGGVFLIAFLAFAWLRVKHGKRSYILNAVTAIKKYRFLIKQLVGRDFKAKYKRSVLGVFWSFLNPLLMMIVQYFVFSTLFKSDIPNFAAYLIIGTVMFNFFSESCSMTLGSILGNAGLITKVYMPKYIYPLTRTMSSVINLAISLIPLFLVCVVTGVQFTQAAVLSLYFFACLIVFCLGLGMLLATSMVFFRDTQFLWSVCTMMWMYATPIFYPESILPPNLKFVHQLNPLYHFLKNVRICILDGISPEPIVYVQCLLIALFMLLIGAVVFSKNQDKFILYL